MALLEAAAHAARGRIAVVATYDHGTGAAARRAVRVVRAACARLSLPMVCGGGTDLPRTEAAWRAARWKFLRGVAEAHGARIATAHTRDDHVETVLMRALRGSGARGLAGLHAESAVVRPFLSLDRGTVRAFVEQVGVPFVDDPANDSRRYLRNRVRLDLLPAMRRARPGIDDELLDVSRGAAAVRRKLEARARQLSVVTTDGGLDVAASKLAGYSRESLAAAWPAMAARVGLTLDRRGTERVVAFTINGRVGRRVQVSGGWELHAGRERFELRRTGGDGLAELALRGVGRWGRWRFDAGPDRPDDPWTATLPADGELVVRRWRPGDRMIAAGATQARRVKRFLSDARISGARRVLWPVVVLDGTVVWIPGVRRGDAATARPGRPEVSYECEFDDRG